MCELLPPELSIRVQVGTLPPADGTVGLVAPSFRQGNTTMMSAAAWAGSVIEEAAAACGVPLTVIANKGLGAYGGRDARRS